MDPPKRGRNQHLIAKFEAAMPRAGLFVAVCWAHITVIAAAADPLRWGALSPFVISREE